MAAGDTIVFNDPNNYCFGCSQTNPHGLQLTFTDQGAGSVRTTYTAPAHTCGPPQTIHGGVQAVMLDEACGFAVHSHYLAETGFDAGEDRTTSIVTASFELRYRAPAPVGAPVILIGEVTGTEGRNYFLSGRIEGIDGTLMTECTARWVRLAHT